MGQKNRLVKTPGFTCYIKGCNKMDLPESWKKENGLYRVFSKYGEVTKIRYRINELNSEPFIAFCTYSNNIDRVNAENELDNTYIEGILVSVTDSQRDDSYIETKSKTVDIDNVPSNVTMEILKKHLKRFGDIHNIGKYNNTSSYWVTFKNLEGANRFYQLSNVFTINDEVLYKKIPINYKSKLSSVICNTVSKLPEGDKKNHDTTVLTEKSNNDVSVQTEIEYNDISIQTEIEYNDISVQTEKCNNDVSVQTEKRGFNNNNMLLKTIIVGSSLLVVAAGIKNFFSKDK